MLTTTGLATTCKGWEKRQEFKELRCEGHGLSLLTCVDCLRGTAKEGSEQQYRLTEYFLTTALLRRAQECATHVEYTE
jgi:hypothetical protein